MLVGSVKQNRPDRFYRDTLLKLHRCYPQESMLWNWLSERLMIKITQWSKHNPDDFKRTNLDRMKTKSCQEDFKKMREIQKNWSATFLTPANTRTTRRTRFRRPAPYTYRYWLRWTFVHIRQGCKPGKRWVIHMFVYLRRNTSRSLRVNETTECWSLYACFFHH